MSSLTDDALRVAATEAGLLDLDMLQHDAFVGARMRFDSGEISASETIAAMRSLRPAWFSRDWSRMDDREFSRRDAALRDELSRRASRPERESFRELDAATLTPAEEVALRSHLAGTSSSYEVSILRAAVARQKGSSHA